MGAVSRQIYNIQLVSISDYTNTAHLKSLLTSYHNLKSLAEEGDYTAADIYFDLKEALKSDRLTPTQKRYLIEVYVNKCEAAEYAREINRSESTISLTLKKALDNLSAILEGGELYGGKKSRGTS
jgi:DNA-directed RNA polymerase specialized sigma24 family protein